MLVLLGKSVVQLIRRTGFLNLVDDISAAYSVTASADFWSMKVHLPTFPTRKFFFFFLLSADASLCLIERYLAAFSRSHGGRKGQMAKPRDETCLGATGL